MRFCCVRCHRANQSEGDASFPCPAVGEEAGMKPSSSEEHFHCWWGSEKVVSVIQEGASSFSPSFLSEPKQIKRKTLGSVLLLCAFCLLFFAYSILFLLLFDCLVPELGLQIPYLSPHHHQTKKALCRREDSLTSEPLPLVHPSVGSFRFVFYWKYSKASGLVIVPHYL